MESEGEKSDGCRSTLEAWRTRSATNPKKIAASLEKFATDFPMNAASHAVRVMPPRSGDASAGSRGRITGMRYTMSRTCKGIRRKPTTGDRMRFGIERMIASTCPMSATIANEMPTTKRVSDTRERVRAAHDGMRDVKAFNVEASAPMNHPMRRATGI
jgi:hypothetical protein